GFSAEDRIENIRRIAEIGKLFVQTGVVTLACFVSPTNDIRQMAREIVGKEDFLEVYISTPIEECERRDVKGLYARARKGEVKNFTGISAPFEAPVSPDIAIDTSKIPLEESVRTLTELIIKRVKQQ
ncbi:MAG: adenylyl-sulfate kinase, partial [Paraprevotella sp.]|nr:adenylyl-sulfate kinase [Paraprevotella sp.]